MKVSAMTDEPVVGERWICARPAKTIQSKMARLFDPGQRYCSRLHKAAVALLAVATKERRHDPAWHHPRRAATVCQ